MALVDTPLDRISAADLQRLIDTKAAESVYIDYKAATYGATPDDHREFLADISSFANTVGGDLVIGMTETNGIPNGFQPISPYPEPELLRLDNMARSGLEPRISNLKTRAVLSPNGGYVIIVRVPRSYNQPHRVIHGNRNRFWARSSASPRKYEPNVEELRRIFNESSLLTERILAFRESRINKIFVSKNTPVAMTGICFLVLHVVPYSGFNLGAALSVAEMEKQWKLFPPLGRRDATHRYVNFDGFVTLSNQRMGAAQSSYAQVFRSGAIEAVSAVERGDGAVGAADLDKYCAQGVQRYVDALSKLDISCPMAVLASIVGVRGKKLVTGIDGLYSPEGEVTIRDEQLHFSEVVLESVAKNSTESALALHQLREQIWNTAGFASQQTITGDGRYLFPG
jgi:hypothetical protein